ncbi:MAG: magnesium/cobalt efflux protein, partial [Pseudomonadota bacterium]|nr:magnesium/cobalt efflux protein [Pseudomonadota bacterium]
MSDTSELLSDSAETSTPRRGVREWLSDLFSDEPEDLPELLSILRDAAERQLIDLDALNIIFGALQVSDMHARDIMIP